MRYHLRGAPNLLLMADAVPASTPYVLRSVQQYCTARELPLPHVWVLSRNPFLQTDLVSWIETPPPSVGNKDFQYLYALKYALGVIQKKRPGPVEINPLPSFTLPKSLASQQELPIARFADQQVECTTCRSDGIKSLTLRALQRMGKTYYDFDLGAPFVVHPGQMISMALGMQVPYAVETYYNNTHGIQPGAFIDAIRVIAEQRFLSVTPTQINEALLDMPMVAFTQNGWNRWIAEWCAHTWPTASVYETGTAHDEVSDND